MWLSLASFWTLTHSTTGQHLSTGLAFRERPREKPLRPQNALSLTPDRWVWSPSWLIPGDTHSLQNRSFVPNYTFSLADGELYSGTSADFMGRDFAIFRTLGDHHPIRTEQHDSRWLNGKKKKKEKKRILLWRESIFPQKLISVCLSSFEIERKIWILSLSSVLPFLGF